MSDLAEAKRDPRFAKHLRDDSDEFEEEEEEDAAVSESESGEEEEMEEAPDSIEDEDEEEEAEEEEEEEACDWTGGERVEWIEARRRVAIVNCNWDYVRAVDLYAILFHGLPLGGQLLEVCVYKSEFGKKMIEHERIHGPDLWVKPGEEDPTAKSEEQAQLQESELMNAIEGVEEMNDDEEEDDDEDVDDGDEEEDDGWVDDNPAMMNEQGEEGEFFSSGKYRQYEMNRMKYYYAIATFDSADTAAAVYNELDGMDIEASGVLLDLRYVDDDEAFDASDMVSRADRIPTNFKPLSSLKNAALSQTRFRISWDQDDPIRHHSVQDSFSGTTPEDDIAAYIATADSDEEEGSHKKKEEKRRIRHKYAALLQEIGVDPDEVDEERGSQGNSSSDNADSSSDDDDLNRLSDVELSNESDEGDEEGNMEMEATLDLDANEKAIGLQRDARVRRILSSGDLSEKAETKYKLRRKEAKKLKKEAILREREEEREMLEVSKEEQKRKLQTALGTDDEGATRLSGKERRKLHAQAVKARLATERLEKKKVRAANILGVGQKVREQAVLQQGEDAAKDIDPRFQSKLLSDPRYHLEVAQKDKRMSSDVVELASKVTRAKRSRSAMSGPSSTSATSHSAVDSTVDFFLKEGKKRIKKESAA